MLPKLKKFNIEIVALSNDEVSEIKIHEKRDTISYKLLADPDLKVIKGFGVEHQKAIWCRYQKYNDSFWPSLPEDF